MSSGSPRPTGRVVAVVVAYNRRDLLGECLGAILAQQRPVDAVVVVDNASTDDSVAVAAMAAPNADILALTRNTGGAGGFTVGIARAMAEHDPDWVWVMDDDTVPTPTALEELLAAEQALRPLRPAVLASRVVWTDGSDHPMNTPRTNPFAGRRFRRQTEAADAYPMRSASFVSSLISARAIRKYGYPVVDYFLWNDDFEYLSRIIRRSAGVLCRRSVVVHKTKVRGSTDADPGERFYWEVRNKLWLFRRSSALGILEKLTYGGSSVRRWVKTFRKSGNRKMLGRAFRRGFRDGLRGGPRANSEALAGAGVPSTLLSRVDTRQ
jgi:rhamnopyranosyl-N-acetylglucosaminyl-diphospho-decaprenol beta-1,3/1,4-galactofuranosyltransferase